MQAEYIWTDIQKLNIAGVTGFMTCVMFLSIYSMHNLESAILILIC